MAASNRRFGGAREQPAGLVIVKRIDTYPYCRGALFENWVISELCKARANHGLPSNLFFWRDQSGHEVDVLLETAAGLIPIEIKSGQTLNSDFFKGLEHWFKLARPKQPRAWLVYGGKDEHLRDAVRILSWRNLQALTAAE